ncbi:urea transporter [Streptomyces sp. CC208A]|uniref:urea transporter n=1 Tax=Streptomyces sp. CC208A TaxID=3044573 RepID=UPI0024A8E2D9|nr:urea transporter [Streptomyces sp. CC208A]
MNWSEAAENNKVLGFADIVLRSAGQVIIQNNPLSGAIVIAALFVGSWRIALFFLAGCVLATLAAYVLKAEEGLLRAGGFGFAGGYAAILFGGFREAHHAGYTPGLWIALVFGVLFTVPLISGSTWLLTKIGLLPLALPIIVVFWIMVAGALYDDLPKLAEAQIPQLVPAATDTATAYTWGTAFDSLGNGFSGMFFITEPLTGYLMLLAVLVNSRIMAPWPSSPPACPS